MSYPPDPAGTGRSTGPARTRRSADITAPTQDELDRLPAEKRLELINQRQQNRHQQFNTIGILFGVVFTALSLAASAVAVFTARQELRTTQEGQITDRYSRAVSQLGASHGPVRIGGIYSLQRIAAEQQEGRRVIDQHIIIDVLSSFVRSRDPAPRRQAGSAPTEDVYIALSVLINLGNDSPGEPALNLRGIRTPHAGLVGANLAGTDLAGADLTSAKLNRANLTGANLGCADLTRANATDADLICANLTGADLTDADLTDADLTGANLTGANLTGARLCRAKVQSVQGARSSDNIQARTRC